MTYDKLKGFLAIRQAISLIEILFYFVEIKIGDTKHLRQMYIDEPSMHPCPLVCMFLNGFSQMRVIITPL